ncbi:lipase family alpha/beta hydrolase [Acinetobacter larvae]|uniref:Alpha/beta hydrolase n=1 Tax=Acinetobacter larvae TaxID=1789224 RepID=A0A1B2M0I5_9GAMM|nr:alpha/beta hydrolase [Acinetobacter larvae]
MLPTHSKKAWLLVLALSPIFITGCQVVSVKNQALNVTIANERDNILTRSKLSEATLNVLSMTGSEAKHCEIDPEQCITGLLKIPQIQDEQLYSAASELYLSRALALDSECKLSRFSQRHKEEKQQQEIESYHKCLDQQIYMYDKSIRYSYVYLFKTRRGPQDRIFDNRQVQIRDFYNQALAKMITTYSVRHKTEGVIDKELKFGNNTFHINFTGYPQLANESVESLLSSYNLNFSGLRSINRRDGFGSEFIAILNKPDAPEMNDYIIDPLHHKYKNGMNPNIHQPRYLSVSIVAEPRSDQYSIEQILNNADFDIKVFDPYSVDNLKVAGREYPLAANFSAPYGLWLAENKLGISAYLSLIDRDQNLTMPHLYMLEPYNPNKKVIVLVHGLASSPEAWIRLTNDIMGDPVLRDHYQVWQVFYSTNMPIFESRYQINAIINQTFSTLDPQASAAKDAVLIGHSMGGIIARLLVSDHNLVNSATTVFSPREANRLKQNPIFQERLTIKPIENFDRAIFLAAPHRGTAFADRWFTRLARRIIKLPGAFVGAMVNTIEDKDIHVKDFVNEIGKGIIQNGPSDLSHNSKFTLLTEDIQPRKGMIFHSIMGNVTDSNDPDVMTDGIVPYKSAHLGGAKSEKIIKGGHSIQETPEAVLELRRILREHLTQLNIYKPNS